MKNKRKLFGVLLMVALITVIFIAGYTYARYYQKIDVGRSSASIARWSFGSQSTETSISLAENKIAPGSNGNFEIEVDATGSEVNVEYSILVTEEKNIPTNMKFYAEILDEKGGVIKRTNEYSSFSQLANIDLTYNIIKSVAGDQKRTIVIYWDWPFNEEDTTSTDREDATLVYDENGNSSLDCGFNIEIVGRQAMDDYSI